MPNMEMLKRSRPKLSPGDLFMMKYPDIGYLFGRVIRADMSMGESPMPGDNLVYIYKERFSTKNPYLSMLTRDNLLIPPSFINRQPWLKGYFQTIGNHELNESDILPRHCFYDAPFRRYIDDKGVTLNEPLEPCGEFGLNSILTLDDAISEALGIPRAE
jgi:hypothetical protein